MSIIQHTQVDMEGIEKIYKRSHTQFEEFYWNESGVCENELFVSVYSNNSKKNKSCMVTARVGSIEKGEWYFGTSSNYPIAYSSGCSPVSYSPFYQDSFPTKEKAFVAAFKELERECDMKINEAVRDKKMKDILEFKALKSQINKMITYFESVKESEWKEKMAVMYLRMKKN